MGGTAAAEEPEGYSEHLDAIEERIAREGAAVHQES